MENKVERKLFGCGECGLLFKDLKEEQKHFKSDEHEKRNMPPAPTKEEILEASRAVERATRLELKMEEFSGRALRQAWEVLKSDLKDDYVKFIVSGRFGDVFMHFFQGLFSLDLTQEQEDYIFERFKKGNRFNMFTVRLVEDGIKWGLSIDKIDLFTNMKFNLDQSFTIANAFRDGLTMEQVLTFAKPEIDKDKMWDMMREEKMHNDYDGGFPEGGIDLEWELKGPTKGEYK